MSNRAPLDCDHRFCCQGCDEGRCCHNPANLGDSKESAFGFRGRPLVLEGAAAGRALGILIARRKADAEPIAHLLELRARILRDMAPIIGVTGPGLPVLRQRNVEWAANELDAAAELIRYLANKQTDEPIDPGLTAVRNWWESRKRQTDE
jgi:hypothetical protein